jgi:hypothetical protein
MDGLSNKKLQLVPAFFGLNGKKIFPWNYLVPSKGCQAHPQPELSAYFWLFFGLSGVSFQPDLQPAIKWPFILSSWQPV